MAVARRGGRGCFVPRGGTVPSRGRGSRRPTSGASRVGLGSPRAQSEFGEQQVVAQWLALRPHVLWTATAAGGPRHIVAARRLRASGVVAGVPDLLVFTPPRRVPPPWVGPRVGVAIELKSTAKSARLSPVQKHRLQALDGCGWLATVARGADEAITLLQRCGY